MYSRIQAVGQCILQRQYRGNRHTRSYLGKWKTKWNYNHSVQGLFWSNCLEIWSQYHMFMDNVNWSLMSHTGRIGSLVRIWKEIRLNHDTTVQNRNCINVYREEGSLNTLFSFKIFVFIFWQFRQCNPQKRCDWHIIEKCPKVMFLDNFERGRIY